MLGSQVVGDVAGELVGPPHVVTQLHPEVKVVQHAQLPEHVVRMPARISSPYHDPCAREMPNECFQCGPLPGLVTACRLKDKPTPTLVGCKTCS